MSDDLLDAVRELPKVVQVSARAGAIGLQRVLKRMKRLYTVEYYREMLHRCRERVPGVAVSSDFIVGFCGETEESFQKTCDLVRDGEFKNSFIFKYSARPGTKADELFPDDVPEEVKKRRNNDLLAIQNAVSLADHRGAYRRDGRGAGGGPEQERAEARCRPRPEATDRPHDDGSHRRLRRQRTADRPHGVGADRGSDVVHAVRQSVDDGTGGG